MNKRSLTPILALWLGYLAWAAPCLGQIHLALGAGPSVPLGDLGDGSTAGFHVIGMTFLGLDQSTVSGRLDLSYSHFYADRAGQNQATNVLAVGAAVVIAPRPTSSARPYATAGLGLYRAVVYCPPEPTGVGLNAGLGVRFRRFVVEGRFHLAYTGCNTLFHIPLTFAVNL